MDNRQKVKQAIEQYIKANFSDDSNEFYQYNRTDHLTYADRRLIVYDAKFRHITTHLLRTLAPDKFKHQIYAICPETVVGISFKDGKLSYSQVKKSNIDPFIESLIEITGSCDILDHYACEVLRRQFRLYLDASPTEYKLNTITISEGYNLRDLPSSCMKGQGLKFKPLDTMGKMYYLTSNKTTNILARCIVWDKGVVINSTDDEPIDCQLYDKVYQLEGKYGNIFKDMLEAKGILELDRLEAIDTWNLYINNPFIEIENGNYPWMDRFSLLDINENRLYYYDWNAYGHNSSDLKELAMEVNPEKYKVLLSTDGYTRDMDENDGTIYSEYENSDIEEDDAVWSENLNSHISSNNAVWSQTERDYFHEDDYGNGWYYNWDDRDEPINIENPDFVEFQDSDDTRYMVAKSNAVEDMLSENISNWIPKELAIEIKSLGPNYYIYDDYLVSIVKEHFEQCLDEGKGDADEFKSIVENKNGEWTWTN
ncbi:hypothetical protein [Campylobacter concisus]|uniref:Uncharacterized protein n=1 Tax=Campylobacter concisus TaxID=199 RepID=A0A1Y5MKZ8_9BACT|nr:hypothetical protein [Campylobacter concisus]OUT06869.1 hypothetical protein B9N65_09825 [Campylobacter concisus]OUT08967.1 hypothetical protein B9N65_01100 [Campylobacter concisus]